LRAGWNLVSQKINDQVRSFLVYGGAAKPAYDKKPGSYGPDEKPKPGKETKPGP
jgi:hypothetical protein